jgi:hypothetical protein
MPDDLRLLAKPFVTWPTPICPVCNQGTLTVHGDDVEARQTTESVRAQNHSDWEPDWDHGYFHGTMHAAGPLALRLWSSWESGQ